MKPSPNDKKGNGRDARGRFVVGNPGGPGNPYARRVARLKTILLEAVTEDDLRAVVAALIKRAREGDVRAARELFDRLVGKVIEPPCEPDGVVAHERMTLRCAAPDPMDEALMGRYG